MGRVPWENRLRFMVCDQGWAGHPSLRLLSLRWFARVPARGRIGDVTRWASGNGVCDPRGLSSMERRRPWFISPSNKVLATVPFRLSGDCRCPKA
jgi:hypothetical protein